MRWNIASSSPVRTIEELRQALLENRQIESVAEFFNPPQPRDITLEQVGINQAQVDLAVTRLQQAKEKQQRVVIFGDYDADGVCATAILWQALHDLGFEVTPFIPEREKHGYGLSVKALKDLYQQVEPELIITVDNGIVAHEAAEYVATQKTDLIITDHHQPEAELPVATAVVHTTQLCGATVSWMLAREITKSYNQKINSSWQLDLAGLATIADQVPLKGANRAFAYHGIEALKKTKRLGLIELYQQAGIEAAEITAQTVGFGLAPRINAMGRLKHSLDALRLLLSTKRQRVKSLAFELGETNAQRQDLTYEMYGQALSQAKEWQDEHIIIVASADYHEGVLGLIAGRLTERFNKPAIALSLGEEGIRASARSIEGVNVIDLIREVKSDLTEAGGHPMAAGFGMKASKLETVTQKLKKLAKKVISAEMLEPVLEVETELDHQLLSLKTAQVINEFAPFGQQNPQPVFAIHNLEILQPSTIGKNDAHLKIVVTADGSTPLECLFWRQGKLLKKIKSGQTISIAGVLEINTWRGKSKIQLVVKDLLLAESSH